MVLWEMVDINGTLKRLVTDTFGVKSISVTDEEGVTIASASCDSDTDEELHTRLALTYQMVIDYLPKFELGQKQSLTLCFNSNRVLVLNMQSLIVIIIANFDAGMGTLRKLRGDLAPIIGEIVKAANLMEE